MVYSHNKEYEESGRTLEKGASLFEETGEIAGAAWQYGNIGSNYRDTGRYKDALEQYFKAFDIFENLNDSTGMADQCANIAYIYVMLKKNEEGILWYTKSLLLYYKLKDASKAEMVRLNLSTLDNRQN